MSLPSTSTVAGILCRWILRLYPRWFRELYAEQIEADIADLLRDAGRRTPWSHIGFLVRDLARSLLREWLLHVWRPPRAKPPPIRASKRGKPMDTLIHDLRYALRMFRHQPAFTAMVIVTLGIGIGANVAMFSVVDRVLLSALPYRDAERLVMVWNQHLHTGAEKVQVSGMDFLDYRDQTRLFEDFTFIHDSTDNNLTDEGPAEQIDVGYVSSNFFRFLGRDPMLGRGFNDEDEQRTGGTPSAVISHALWARRYGSDPTLVGRTISVARRPLEVIGVMPADFEVVLPYSEGGVASGGIADVIDVWRILPERSFPRFPRSMAMFRVLARLKPGVTVEQAQEEIDVLAGRLREEHRVHAERGTRVELVPMHADVVGRVRSIVLSLFGAVGFVLIIACANVANLVLVRAANRRHEVAVRLAVGAHRGRLLRQLLTENGLLALAGAVAGLALAKGLIDVVVGLAPANVPMLEQVGIDGRALGFAVGAAVVAMLLFGLWPALGTTRLTPAIPWNETSRRGTGDGHRLRTAIATAEIALSLVLLVGGGLLIRSFLELSRTRLGFDPASALTAKVALGHGAYDDDVRRANYWNALRLQTSELANVDAAGLVWPLPFADPGTDAPYARTSGDSDDWGRFVASVAKASPGYFEAVGAGLLDGRFFLEADLDPQRRDRFAVVDEVLAERLFPGQRAVGLTFWVQPLGSARQEREILGVVRQIRHSSLTGPEREVVYLPTAGDNRMALVVRSTSRDPMTPIPQIRAIASSLDPEVPLFEEWTLAHYLDQEMAPTRFTMTLATAFAIVALTMAVIGLYGVISYSVARRVPEIAVRVALGAPGGAILGLVLRHGATMAGLGIGIGLAAALLLTRTIQSLLVGVAPTDALTFGGVSLLLTGATLVASYLPARRAARLDPIQALRNE